jgi:aromatic-L-amino-acid/L-tryptophan decarboxylase
MVEEVSGRAAFALNLDDALRRGQAVGVRQRPEDLPKPKAILPSMTEPTPRKATLDLDDDELRALLAGAADLAEREIKAARNGPVFLKPPSGERLAALFDGERGLPRDGEPLADLLHACDKVLSSGRRTNPGFFGYVQSPPSPIGVAADLLASAADQNVTAWRSAPAATEVERIAVRWLGELAGFAENSHGLLVGGGSAANLTALLVAVQTRSGVERGSLAVYTSDEAHFSVAKAAAVLGVELRPVPVDAAWRLDPGELREQIDADRAAGLEPFCVVGSAGSTGTGAVDPLDAIAGVAADSGVWFHVDGAYGALAAVDPASSHLFAGMERADSLALDPHKWLYAPVDCGALLVRDPEAGARAFGASAGAYVRVLADQPAESFAFWDHGIELSRRFRALKVWMTLRYYGADRIAAAIAEDIAMAAHLAELVEAAEDLELLAGPNLSICCFRHVPPGVPEADLDGHNERLLDALQRDGRVYLSNAEIHGRFALRACVTNFRTTRDDIEQTVDVVRKIGAG